jgi:hypothetical protein|tara:strand:+ start:790 stop:1161 length:372 start_codon:yes stop_codon:yes gene_type:complete
MEDKDKKLKDAQKALDEALKTDKKKQKPVTFERPHGDKMPDKTGHLNTKGFHIEKGEEKHTYKIITKREYIFHYTIRAKNEEDAMVRTLRFVSQDGSGGYMQGPMQLGRPLIREWIDSIEKLD